MLRTLLAVLVALLLAVLGLRPADCCASGGPCCCDSVPDDGLSPAAACPTGCPGAALQAALPQPPPEPGALSLALGLPVPAATLPAERPQPADEATPALGARAPPPPTWIWLRTLRC